MASSLTTADVAQNRASRRTPISFTGLTSVSATGIFTLSAGGFLDDLQNGDVVQLSALTGGSSLVAATDYFLVGLAAQPASGATTFQLATSPLGDWVTHGSNVTVGTITKGKALTGQGETLPSPQSARGR